MHLRMKERNIYISAYRYRDIHMYIFYVHIYIHLYYKQIYLDMQYIIYPICLDTFSTYVYIFKYIYSPYTFLYIQESVLKCSLYVLSIGLHSYPGETLVSSLL